MAESGAASAASSSSSSSAAAEASAAASSPPPSPPPKTAASIADDYVSRLNTAISVTLGLYEAANIANGVYVMRYLCAFIGGIALTFYADKFVRELEAGYGGLFVLPARIAKRVLASVQDFLTTIVFQIIIHKVHVNDENANAPLRLVTKFAVYAGAFVLLTSAPALYSWYLYEDAVLDMKRRPRQQWRPQSPHCCACGTALPKTSAPAVNCAAATAAATQPT